MRGNLVTAAGVTPDPQRSAIAGALASAHPFWLDLAEVDPEAVAVLGEDFGFHPLAVEDAEDFGQRPKCDDYDSFVLLVAYGAAADGRPIEVHCFLGASFLVTVHREQAPGLDAVLGRWRAREVALPSPQMLLYRVLDGLVDGFFPVLETFDESIDRLQDDILRRPTDAQLGELFRLKRTLIKIRRLASEQRDVFGSVLTDPGQLPGMSSEVERYFRDLYDHVVRISQTADGYRDLLSSVLDTYLSTTSNRLNVVMKQLAIIATVFLPMSFVTGFFGQNFAWLTDRIGGPAVFWIAGVALQVAVVVGLLAMFWRMGWLGDRRSGRGTRRPG